MARKLVFKSWLISGLRRLCQKWPPYYETKLRRKEDIFITGSCKLKGKRDYIVYYHYPDDKTERSMYAHHAPKEGKRVAYRCEICEELFLDKDFFPLKDGRWKKQTTTVVDHINPVVGVEGFEDWNRYITRMFCPEEDRPFQCICRKCHDEKSEKENEQRREKTKTSKPRKNGGSPKKGKKSLRTT